MAPQEIIIEPANPDYYYYPDDISDVPVDFPPLPNGEAANVTWLKNNAPLEEADLRSRRVRIRTHEYWSRLVINSLHVLDSAQYKCRASNSAGSVETSGILRVAPGTSHSAPQSIGGDMGVDDLMLDYENEMTPLDTLQGPSSSGSRPQDWFVTEKRGQFEPGTCVPYAGNACAEHLRGERVLVMSDNPEDMYDIERHLQAAAMFIADHQDLSSQCKHYSNRVACLHKFKVCAPGVTKLHQVTQSDRDKVKGKVRRLCRRDCDRLKSDLCPKEYSLAEEHSLVGDGPQHMLPKCANLDNSPNCFSIDAHAPGAESNVSAPPQTPNVAMSPLDAVQTSHICYVGSGRTYRGATSQTENGYQCLRWAGAAPKRLLDDFPSLHGAANFCRNPDGSKVRPWCYAGPTGNEHYCNVPRCADGMFPNLVEMEGRLPVGGRDWNRDQGGVEPTEPSINKNSSKPGSQLANSQVFQFWNSLPRHYQYAAACGATALILLLLIAFICCCWKSCRRHGKKKLRRQGGAAQDASAKSNGPLLNGTGGGSVVNCQNGPQVHNSYGRPPGHPNGSAHSAVGGSLGGSAFGGPPEMNALLPQQNAQHNANAYYYHQLTGQTTPSLVQLPSTHQPTCQQPLPSTTPQLAADWLNFGQLLGQTDQVALWQGEMHPPANVNGSLLAQLQRDCNNGIDEEGIQVALVSVQEHASPTAQREFQQETQFAAQLRHANVLQLLGICAAMRPMCAVYEFGVHGDLHEFLKLRRPATSQSDPAPGIGHRDSNSGSNVGSTQADKERVSLDHADFLHIAKQIAAGMSYLAARSYVHRDLASRNCMVTDRLSIKITCFSVPRSAYSDDYCLWPIHAESLNPTQHPTRALLPIRWLPPESLLCGQFNEQSDVWSFGVTLWEVFSYGAKPYSNYGNEQVLQLLGQRCLLECPKECPTRMYSVMMECWAESAGRRPSLAELHARLQSWSVLSSPAQSNAMFPTASGAPSAANGISNAQRPSSVTSGQTSSALVPLGRTSRQSMPNPVPVDQSTPLQQHPSNAPGGHFGVGYGSGAGSKQGVGRAQIQGSESPRSGKRNRAPPMSRRPTNYDGDTDSSA